MVLIYDKIDCGIYFKKRFVYGENSILIVDDDQDIVRFMNEFNARRF